ncbi:hypothetical protein ES288_A03G137400v1 [Gossypium darwinii]|uniref:Endonuclease/exonuclease/phosphatase domain-containing protein n=2 Tax=Gossypium TaxID=3633 RepID=A0A5D2R643_GOSTO|nr:hypothetical protein ES288_A03G137400v1 [Gossypium darwinii]TYI36347.1 hypothetical protein ES332_A03G135300v1 [Gossypium tomentosum]
MKSKEVIRLMCQELGSLINLSLDVICLIYRFREGSLLGPTIGTIKDSSEKIDRILCNARWCNWFPNCLASSDIAIGSDHKPLFLCLEKRDKQNWKSFKFRSKWLVNDERKDAVMEGWSFNGSGEFGVNSHIKWRKLGELSQWNNMTRRNVRK